MLPACSRREAVDTLFSPLLCHAEKKEQEDDPSSLRAATTAVTAAAASVTTRNRTLASERGVAQPTNALLHFSRSPPVAAAAVGSSQREPAEQKAASVTTALLSGSMARHVSRPVSRMLRRA